MGFQPSLRDLDLLPVDGPALKSMRENWVVPPGLRSFFPLFPALKRWAKLVRPSGAAFSSSSFHRIAKTSVLTHTLKRRAIFGRPSGTGALLVGYPWDSAYSSATSDESATNLMTSLPLTDEVVR